MRVRLFAVLVTFGWLLEAAAATPPICAGGQFVVQGPTLIPGMGADGTDAVSFSATLVGIQSGCAAVEGRVRGTGKGTKVKARWLSCPGVIGKARLSALVDPLTCNTMTGTFRAPKSRVKVLFTATRATTGACTDGTLTVIQNRIFNYRGCNVST